MTPTARKFLEISGYTPSLGRMLMRHGVNDEGTLVSIDYWFRDEDSGLVQCGTIWLRPDGYYEGMEGCELDWQDLLPWQMKEGKFNQPEA